MPNHLHFFSPTPENLDYPEKSSLFRIIGLSECHPRKMDCRFGIYTPKKIIKDFYLCIKYNNTNPSNPNTEKTYYTYYNLRQWGKQGKSGFMGGRSSEIMKIAKRNTSAIRITRLIQKKMPNLEKYLANKRNHANWLHFHTTLGFLDYWRFPDCID